jgi:hypothetical protein
MNSKLSKSICEKHGDVRDMTLTISKIEDGIINRRHYCIYCLGDIFDALQKSFETPKLDTEIDLSTDTMLTPNVS